MVSSWCFKVQRQFLLTVKEKESFTLLSERGKMGIFNYKNNVIDSISVSYTEEGLIKMNHNHNTDLANIWEYSDSQKSLSKFTKQFGKLNEFTKWDNYGRKVEEGYYNKDKKTVFG